MSTVGNEDRLLTKQIFCSLQMPGRPGHLKLPNVRAGTHHVSNARDLPGGMLADRIDSHIREQSEFKLEGGGWRRKWGVPKFFRGVGGGS